MHMQERWSPTEYHENSCVQFGHSAEILDGLDFNLYHSILDVGSGDGKITHHIAKKAPNSRVVGLDSDQSMIAFSSKEYRLPTLSFTHAAIEDQPFHQAFDLVVSFSTFHWIKNQKQALKGVAAALAPKGELQAILYPRCPYHDAALDAIMNATKWQSYFEDFSESFFNYDVEYYTNLFSDLPFSDYQIERTELEPVHFLALQDLILFMGAWLPQSRHLPKDLAQDFLHELCCIYVKNLGQDPKEALKIPFGLITLKAIKS